MSFTGGVVQTGLAYKQYEEGKDATTQAKDERARIKAAEDEKQKKLDAETAAEKKRANEKAKERLLRRGHGGTVLGGATDASMLGSVIQGA